MSKNILVSIYPDYLNAIKKKKKNFEFRPFEIATNDDSIIMWLYETRPIMRINSFIETHNPVTDLNASHSKHYGLGDDRFYKNISNKRFAYEIKSLTLLNNGLSLRDLKKLGLYNAPQYYVDLSNYPSIYNELKKRR